MPIIFWNLWLFVLARSFQPLAEPMKCKFLSVYELIFLNTYAKMEDMCLFTAKFVSWTVFNLCLRALKVLQKLFRPHHSNCFETSFVTWAILILKKFEAAVFPLQIVGQFWKIFPTFSCLRGRLEKHFVWKNRHKWTRIWKGKGDLYTDALQQLWWLSRFLVDSRCLSLSGYLSSFPWCLSQRVSLGPISFFFSSKLELGRNVEYH